MELSFRVDSPCLAPPRLFSSAIDTLAIRLDCVAALLGCSGDLVDDGCNTSPSAPGDIDPGCAEQWGNYSHFFRTLPAVPTDGDSSVAQSCRWPAFESIGNHDGGTRRREVDTAAAQVEIICRVLGVEYELVFRLLQRFFDDVPRHA